MRLVVGFASALSMVVAAGCGREDSPADTGINVVGLDIWAASGNRGLLMYLQDDDPPDEVAELHVGEGYSVSAEFLHWSELTADGVPLRVANHTERIKAAPEEFLLVFSGSVFEGEEPSLVHKYQDSENSYGEDTPEDLPVGIYSTLRAAAPGRGVMEVALLEFPEGKSVADVEDALVQGVEHDAVVVASQITVEVESY